VYKCNDFRTSLSVAEFYSDMVSIDDVDVHVNGSKAKYISPRYESYSSDGIFYSDEKVCYFNLPLEKKGSTSEVAFEETYKDPRYFTQQYLDAPYDVENHEIIIIIPSWVKAEVKDFNFGSYNIKRTVTNDGGDEKITIVAQNLPARRSESRSQGPTYRCPHILLLTHSAEVGGSNLVYFKNTSDQYNWYAGLVKQIGNENTTIKAKVAEITSSAPSEVDKIKAIYFWVQDNIRYLAFENGIAGFRPEKAQEVLRKKYGDCKGMANLTKEMLIAAGFDARLCWIGTHHIAYDYSTPSLAVDNHMICALLYKGKKYFLDATEKNIGYDQYAERIQGRQVLIEDGEKFMLDRVPATAFAQNTEKEIRDLTIDGTSLKGKASHTYAGESKEYVLSGMESVKKDKLDEAIKRFLTENNRDYAISGLAITNGQPQDGEMKVDYDLAQANAVNAFGKEMYVDLDYRKEYASFKIDTAKRKTDYMFSYKTNLITEASLQMPAGYKIEALPKPFEAHTSGFDIKAGYTKKSDGKIGYRKEITIKDVLLKKEYFDAWNKAIDGLNEFYNNQLTLIKP